MLNYRSVQVAEMDMAYEVLVQQIKLLYTYMIILPLRKNRIL